MNDRYWMPTRIDDPPMFLLWDMDLVIIFILCLALGIASGFFFTSVGGGVCAAWAFSRTKGGKHPYFIKHITYWYTPVNMLGLQRAPRSSDRAFLG